MSLREVRITLLVAALGAVAIPFLLGCAGPSRARYSDLLGQCRRHLREEVRLRKAYEGWAARHPHQLFSEIASGEAGF